MGIDRTGHNVPVRTPQYNIGKQHTPPVGSGPTHMRSRGTAVPHIQHNHRNIARTHWPEDDCNGPICIHPSPNA